MKVNDRNRVLIDPRIGGAGGVAPDGGAGATTGPGGGDQVSVSETARALARLKAEVGDPGAADEYRVATVRALTERGGYTPDVRGAAEGFLREAAGDLLA